MLASRYFIDLTQPEIAAQFKKNPLVILPQGSVEQHGPHLPTGTDIFAANIIAHAVAERMDGLVIPGGPLGVTPLHMPFEGTITLSPDTYIRLVMETCASTAKHGAKYLLILNWHEMKIPPLGVAADRLHRQHGMTVLTVQACFVAEDMFGKECGGLTHGGEIEALAVLAYRPELVHLERIDYSSDHAHGHKVDALRRTRSYQPVLTDVRSITERLRPGLRVYRDEAGRELFDVHDGAFCDPSAPAPVRFLPQFYNVFLGHKDRARIVDLVKWGASFVGRGVVFVDGFLTGAWKLTEK